MDTDVQRVGLHACPARSRLGGGSTEGIAGGGIPFKTVVTLFNARGHIIVLVQVDGRTLTNFRDEVKNGTIHVNAKIPAGISLTKLDIAIPAHSRKGREEETGLCEDAAHMPGERQLDYHGHLHLCGRIRAAADERHSPRGEKQPTRTRAPRRLESFWRE